MTQEERAIQADRMRFTKDKLSSNLVLIAIVFDAFYFVSLYQTDIGSYYYNWKIGASVVYNLLLMLAAFLASEGVKSRKTGYTGLLIFLGVMQVVRIFYLPTQAAKDVVTVSGVEYPAMERGQYIYVVVCLIISAVCCIAAAVNSSINNRRLAQHMATLENKTA